MPNRILRDWTDSDKINTLSPQAERLFTRLIMKADDFGCFYADTRLIKANLFPLLLDSIREADLSRWIAECTKAGLIVLYESKGKMYLQIQDFKQRLDRKSSKYPLPNDNQWLPNDNHLPPEVEVEVETEVEEKLKVKVRDNVSLKQTEISKLRNDFSEKEVEWMFDKLSAYKLSKGKRYKSDYGAILTWVVKSLNEEKEKSSAKKESKSEQILGSYERAKQMLNAGSTGS